MYERKGLESQILIRVLDEMDFLIILSLKVLSSRYPW